MKHGLTKAPGKAPPRVSFTNLPQVVLTESKCLCIDNSCCSGGLCLVTMSFVSWGKATFEAHFYVLPIAY